MVRALWLGLAALLAVHALTASSSLSDATYLAAITIGAVVAWAGVVVRRESGRSVWVWVALALSSNAVAEWTWQGFEWARGTGPDVSVADVFWLGSYALLFGGLLSAIGGARGVRTEFDALIDAAVVGVLALLTVWLLTIHEIVGMTSVSPFNRLVWATYPVLDALLVALVFQLFVSRRRRAAGSWPLLGGATCWLAADLAFIAVADQPHVSVLLEEGWMLGAALLGAAAWMGGQVLEPEAATAPTTGVVVPDVDDQPAPLGARQVAFVVAPLLVPGIVEVVGYLRHRDPNPAPIAVAAGALLLLVFVRGVHMAHATEESRAALRRATHFYEAIASHVSDSVMVLDPDGVVRYHLPFPGAAEDSLGAPALHLAARGHGGLARQTFLQCLEAPGEPFVVEVRTRARGWEGQWYAARMVNLLDDPAVHGVVVTLHDISERKELEHELEHQALHDPLTGLANRALFRENVERAFRRRGGPDVEVALVYLDLDGFKLVNDSLGHDTGDRLLRSVAARLTGVVRAGDTLARLGGDEFAILVDDSTQPIEDAKAITQRISRALKAPFIVDGHELTISASVGIADGEARTADALLRNADVAMYEAKRTNRGAWVLYEASMRNAAHDRLELEHDLSLALERDQLRLVYQPVVTLDDERIVGFEALIRWHHPTRGVISPDTFIGIAEETGMIVEIGQWVLREACRTAQRWHISHPGAERLTMAVNVSARQLADPGLVDAVQRTLVESGLEPRWLVLEMTETVLVTDPDTAAQRLRQLRGLGVRLAIDDFGTGYSSLAYLRHFPVDILKLDRTFIATIDDDQQLPAIVEGLLGLARTLQLETIAEGVELGVQRDRLRAEHCDLAQGFLFSRPLDPLDAELLLTQPAQQPSARTSRSG